MAIQKTEAVLLRRRDLRETSLIVTFYTRDFGKIKGIIRGVRGHRGVFGGASLELFALDQIVFYERRRSDICTISQFDLLEFFDPVRSSLEKLAHAAYMVELLDSVTSDNDKSVDIFDLLVASLRLLSGDSSPKRVARIFEIKLLELLGIMPRLDLCGGCGAQGEGGSRFSLKNGGYLCKACSAIDKNALPILAGTARFMEQVRILPFEKASRIRVALAVGRELESLLRKLVDYHVDRRLNTVRFLHEIERK